MPRNLVLFDLEWNIGYQPYTFNYHGVQQTFRGEIVEIGAVKIDEDANVLDTFSIHLRPRIFRKLQHHIAKVTLAMWCCSLRKLRGRRWMAKVSRTLASSSIFTAPISMISPRKVCCTP